MADFNRVIAIIKNKFLSALALRKKISVPQRWLPSWCKNATKCVSQAWQTVLICLISFLFFYYFLGSQLAENIDTATEYTLPKEKSVKMQTAQTMAFLIKREVDDKMWTPNLPPLFPAYVLDNMPNFQTGIVAAVRDINVALRRMESIDEAQQDDLHKAHKMLSYAPNIWILSKQSSLSLAPSSNTQYRKAAKYLQKFNMRADFMPQPQNLARILAQMSKKISSRTQKNEEHWREHSGDFLDTQADNIFYYNRGYAFSLWQISKALGADFKDIIVGYGAYTDWTYLLSSLQQAARFSPLVVRNGKFDGLLSPNHLIVQNFYLMRAVAAIERIRTTLARGAYAD